MQTTAIACVSLALLCGCAAANEAGKVESAAPAASAADVKKVQLITLDPGHFHASLVQKVSYPQVDPVVHVYAPKGAEVQEHLARIDSFNARAENPTHWNEKVYLGPDFLDRMVKERAGNVVVISGNNAKKAQYISDSINAGFNVLSDKPMAIKPEDFDVLCKAFDTAKAKNVLLLDIMTERFEITTMMQRALSREAAVFGEIEKGTLEHPSITKESVHHYSKMVAGKPLKRPAWFFDVTQQGEGIVDVTTHLVDLIQWECFPEQIIDYKKDVTMLQARHWTTAITPEEFKKVTSLDTWPDYLKKDVSDGKLNVYANGEMLYTLRGVHAKVSVIWAFEAPPGGGDTHYSMMRGTKAALVIRQGKEQNFKPTLYIEKRDSRSDADFEKDLQAAITKVSQTWPGMGVEKDGEGKWKAIIPDKYHNGHEQHFGQVTEKFLRCLNDGKLPEWEVPNMIAKYYTTLAAYKMSRK